VIVDVQRGGGRRPACRRAPKQSDLLFLRLRLPTADTKATCCCSRRDPKECFDFTADALDLADRLQTPVFPHDPTSTIGMNHRLCQNPSNGMTSAPY